MEYVSKRKMEQLYQKSDYDVIGEIGNSARKYSDQDVILNNEGKLIPVFPRGSIIPPFEWIVGYAAISKNTYVAVVKSLIPPLLNRFAFGKNKLS